MARIKDIIAAIVSTGDGFEDTVRHITAAGQSAEPLTKEAIQGELSWISSQNDYLVIKPIVEQNVGYLRVNLRLNAGMQPQAKPGSSPQSSVAARVKKLLQELEVRGELHYPFAFVAGDSALLISVIDFSIIMAIAREQQMQDDRQVAAVPSSLAPAALAKP